MSPLLGLQPVRAQHGPPLSLDQQLRRLLEPQVLHAAPDIRAHHHILRVLLARLRLHPQYQMGTRHLLLFKDTT